MSVEKPKVVFQGYLTKSPTSGGRGRWKERWMELVSYPKGDERGHLRLQYYSSEHKKQQNKDPLGESMSDK